MSKVKIAGIAIVSCICIVTAAQFVRKNGSDSERSFDSKVWKQAENTSTDVRLQMARYLISKHELIGKRKADVESLLGAPRSDVKNPHYDSLYLLGTEKFLFDEDGIWLCIRFQNDHVNDVEIEND